MTNEFTVESMLKAVRNHVFQNYYRELDETPSEEELDTYDIWGDSDVETTDVVQIFSDLVDDGGIPSNYRVQLTVTDQESRYEDMGSQYVLFHDEKPIFSIYFGGVMGVRGSAYAGLREDGIRQILSAIVWDRSNRDGKILETITDISMNAGCLIAKKLISIQDSRELVSNIQKWAKEFEKAYNEGSEDYIGAVDAFAERKLLEAYGTGF